jgi:hypothetical protein
MLRILKLLVKLRDMKLFAPLALEASLAFAALLVTSNYQREE